MTSIFERFTGRVHVCPQKLCESTAASNKLPVGASLGDSPSIHHDNLVTLGQVAQSIRHQQPNLGDEPDRKQTKLIERVMGEGERKIERIKERLHFYPHLCV